jgi:signal transduction histidine kinase
MPIEPPPVVQQTATFLHDTVGPSLSAIGLQLELLAADCERDPALRGRFGEIQNSVENLMEQVRDFSNRLGIIGPLKK